MANIETVGVIGAGQMGAGIVQSCAAAGMKALVWDKDEAFLTRGVQSIDTQLKKLVEKEKIKASDATSTLSRIHMASSLKDFSQCQLVIEAIVENFEIKKTLFSELDSICPKDTILASNTSSISITKIAASTKRPEKVMGIHFMNPVPVMKLVELIKGIQTSEETYQAALALVARMEKTPVLALDSPGFIVNRILVPMVNEAIFLVQEGVKPEDVDNAMKLGTNQPMGPLVLADFVGLDTLLSILQLLHRELGEDKYRPCPLLVKYVEAGWFGKKVGRGFYKY